MYSYALLEKGCYYLIQELADSPINLIRITVETDHCMYVSTFGNEETMEWKKKSDQVFDIIELLSDKVVKDWEEVYNQDAYNYEEGEE
jgi:hypothetical protein